MPMLVYMNIVRNCITECLQSTVFTKNMLYVTDLRSTSHIFIFRAILTQFAKMISLRDISEVNHHGKNSVSFV